MKEKQMNKLLTLMVAALSCALLLPGCGGKKTLKTEGVTGTVTLDGTPLAQCFVYFVPDGTDGNQAVGVTNDAGQYALQTSQGAAGAGTTPGNYKVFFSHEVVVQPAETNSDNEVVKEEVTKSDLPEKYLKAETSGFTANVVKGDNTFDFALTSK